MVQLGNGGENLRAEQVPLFRFIGPEVWHEVPNAAKTPQPAVPPGRWQLQEAKAKFSDPVRRVYRKGRSASPFMAGMR